MSLAYRIFWIDDDTDFPKSIITSLEADFPKTEITFQTTVELNGNNLTKTSQAEHLDLVILDYNLDEKNGDELLQELRASGELTEVVFYSQDPNVHEKCQDLEGVHVCQRGDAAEQISDVVRSFITRCKNVAVMRGVIISEAIDVENRLTDLILDMFGDKAPLFQSRILNTPLLDFGKKIFFVNGVVKEILAEERAKAKGQPDTEWVANLAACKIILGKLDKEIMEPRNILAHSKKSFEDGVVTLAPLIKSEPIKFNNDWKNEIRKNMKAHLTNLAKLRTLLNNRSI